jgi:16S rRNA (adenine1518-N6/adenine1519-N6)-dimethyltransferase
MNRSELLLFLEEIGARPKKSLSQNFLIDTHKIKSIVDLAEVHSSDCVLEIGPGPGALTKALLATGAHVIAIEKDGLFAHHLHRLQTPDLRLDVRCADILEFPLDSLPYKSYKVVANLPYQITTPILAMIFANASLFQSLTIMLQKEVADRIRAHPRSKEFGSLTLFAQAYTTFHAAFAVTAPCFYPKPKVDSTVIRLDIQNPPLAMDPSRLFPMIRAAFQQRRKMIPTSLKSRYPGIREALAAAHIPLTSRPEELSLANWMDTLKNLSQ